MIQLNINKIIFCFTTLFITGLIIVLLFLVNTQTGTADLVNNTSQTKEFVGKVNQVLNTTLNNIENFKIIVNAVEDKTNKPAKTEKISEAKNDFKLTLEVDYFIKDDKYDSDFLKKVLSHELMHIVSLQNTQFEKFNDNKFGYSLTRQEFDLEESKCNPNYFNLYGCLKSDSYLSVFYKQFWTGEMRAEYDQIQKIEDKQGFSNELVKWGEKYKDQFVSQIAFTDPEEDLAESFSMWVLDYDTIDFTEVQKSKIQFFENYPELKTIKENFLKNFESSF